ncbi:pmba protein (tlde protein) [Thermococcus chitonophagus]|uniref:Pmba protein (Tlde protein) n=1 Tax=Thermococcus chitonophagus TaxID=54262 RepID=A0A160VQZ5_9EURY|nr:TldD/PmbA family protein [Thermococcus chitonophagus]ASJ15917.1 pmba protein (tlde protein) [Thermococcus chitonophagus]CUX77160.1 TldE protein, part of TldE/TldD proteolytic complex [Thermococcus chitonophagus]
MIDKLVEILERMNFEWEIYWSKSKVSSIKLRKTRDIEVERATYRTIGGVGVRIRVDGYVGFSYMSGFSDKLEKLESLVKRAYKIAKLGRSEHPGFPTPKRYPNVSGLYDSRIEELTVDTLISWGTALLDAPQNGEASIGFEVREREVLNSNGVEARDKSTEFAISLYVYEKGRGTGSHFGVYRSLPDVDREIEGIKEKALWEFELSSKAKKIDNFTGEVVIEPKALVSILSVFLPNVSAKNVYLGKSRFSKTGEEVASEIFTLVDDPTVDGGPGSYAFDGEGNPGKRKAVIDKGVLKSFLADEKYGRLLGIEGGNASRSYSSPPEIASSNIIVPPGDSKIEEGVFIRSVYGEHTANSITGDFSLNIELGYILKGRDVVPFKGNMLSGNVFEMLRNICEVGKDVETIGGFMAPKVVTYSKIV